MSFKKLFKVAIFHFPSFLTLNFLRVHLILIGKIRIRYKILLLQSLQKLISSEQIIIRHESNKNEIVELKLSTPNIICLNRAQSFSTKEPDTLWWIEKFGSDGAFVDIGANIGLYSLYFAKIHKSKVYSFEPSINNLEMLTTNIFNNQLEKKIDVFPVALTNKILNSTFKMPDKSAGSALAAFGVDYGWDGKPIQIEFSHKTLGLTLDLLLELNLIEQPALIKIDVDGIENLILEGAERVLRNAECRHVLLEVNPNFVSHAIACENLLATAGFRDITSEAPSTMSSNQIWTKYW